MYEDTGWGGGRPGDRVDPAVTRLSNLFLGSIPRLFGRVGAEYVRINAAVMLGVLVAGGEVGMVPVLQSRQPPLSERHRLAHGPPRAPASLAGAPRVGVWHRWGPVAGGSRWWHPGQGTAGRVSQAQAGAGLGHRASARPGQEELAADVRPCANFWLPASGAFHPPACRGGSLGPSGAQRPYCPGLGRMGGRTGHHGPGSRGLGAGVR